MHRYLVKGFLATRKQATATNIKGALARYIVLCPHITRSDASRAITVSTFSAWGLRRETEKRRPHPSNRGLLRSAQYSAMWETTPAWKRSLHLSPFAQEPSVGKAQSPFYKNRHENKTLNWAGLGRTALNTEQKQVGGMFIRKALVRSAMRAEDVLLDRARKVLEYYYPGPLNRTNENKFLPARLNHVARTRVISSSLRPSISPNERCVSVDSSVEAEE